MRYVDSTFPVIVVLSLVGSAAVRSSADGPVFIHAQRYAMGTMFDIAAYHPARAQAERAIEMALAEVVRLDHVLSHYDPDSDLTKLIRRGRGALVDVEPALYDVLNESMEISRRSGGSFDVTVGPWCGCGRLFNSCSHLLRAFACPASGHAQGSRWNTVSNSSPFAL